MKFIKSNWQKINFFLFSIAMFLGIGSMEKNMGLGLFLILVSPVFIMTGHLIKYKEG